jgi:hypothetical protein
MGANIRLPNITAKDTEGKMTQMQSYMHQLVEQLNWALDTVDSAIVGNPNNIKMSSAQSSSMSEQDALDTFNAIKALIIKSADIVLAYEDAMKETFNGIYVAQSDFGTYQRQTSLNILTNSTGITEVIKSVQAITNANGTGTLDGLQKSVDGYIRRGILDTEDGNEIIGIELGQTTNGTFKKSARFSPNKLSFYDETEKEVAYISNNMLYIEDAVFLGTVQMGGYQLDTSDGLAFLWGG